MDDFFRGMFGLPSNVSKVYVLQFMKTLNSVGIPYEAADADGR